MKKFKKEFINLVEKGVIYNQDELLLFNEYVTDFESDCVNYGCWICDFRIELTSEIFLEVTVIEKEVSFFDNDEHLISLEFFNGSFPLFIKCFDMNDDYCDYYDYSLALEYLREVVNNEEE